METTMAHTTMNTEIEKFKLCSEMSKRYSCSLSDLLNISMQMYQGYPFTVSEKRIYIEHGIPFNVLRAEINKLKQTEMEIENKNERTYWVIFISSTLGDIYLMDNGGYSHDIMSAKRYGDLYSAKINCRDIECTLAITEPIYKEGDILRVAKSIVIIFDKYDPEADRVYTKAFLSDCLDVSNSPFHGFEHISGFATESQKQRLFGALEKEGKRWNSEKKALEDISKPCSISFAVKLNQESVDRLMGEIDKIREHLSDSKKKSEELFKKIQDAANPKLSEMAKLKQTLEENYEIESADFTQNRLGYLDETSEKLIVTYKPRRK